jgi:hypothetical protein
LPLALLGEADVEMRGVPQERLFNDSRYQKVKETWCAAMLGLGYQKHVASCLVAVNDSPQRGDVDLFLSTGGRDFGFQLVEVMEPERRRGAEYKGFANGSLRSIPYQPERGRIEGPVWIAEKIKQKVEKNYAGAKALNLLVYLNFSALQIQHADVIDASRPFLDRFASIWVVSNLWLGSLYVGNDLGRIDGWGQIFTPEEAMERFDAYRDRD